MKIQNLEIKTPCFIDNEVVLNCTMFTRAQLSHEKNANDDSIRLAYYMVGSDKLFSDVKVPIQNVISENIDKVFKLLEIGKYEIDKFADKASKKTFYNKQGYKKKKTQRPVLVIKRKQNQKKRFEKTKFQKKMYFVHGTSSGEEKNFDLVDRLMKNSMLERNNNNRPKIFEEKCIKCQQVGHVGHKCPNLKPVDVEKDKKKYEVVKQKSPKFEPK
ncbi:putative transcription factor interactor and regulator CCHC(Zn) family [Helianthus anomalus]